MRLVDRGSGPLVLQLPGLAGGVGLYHEQATAARQAGFRVAELDLSGDRADDPAPGKLTWAGLTGEVFEALDRLGAPRAVLWGTSFGSLIALAAAAERPERVQGLLLSSPPDPRWRPAPYQAILDRAGRGRHPARVATIYFRTGFLLLNSWEFANPVALARLPRLARIAASARTPSTTIHDKLNLLFGDGLDVSRIAPAVRCSIVAGAWDTITSPGASRRLADAIPGSRLRLLPFTGHACAYSRPRSYARLAIEELRYLVQDPEGP